MTMTPTLDHPHCPSTATAAPRSILATAPLADGRGRLLTIGWAVSVAMWAVAYVTMMGPGLAVGEALVAVMLAVVVAGGAYAARDGGLPAALSVGAISAGLNMLLIGSLFGSEDRIDLGEATMWIGALWGVTLACAAIGGAIGRRFPAVETEARWPARFACVTVGTVFLLLITGGLVTGLKAGLAVPDWPNSFGHNMLLYPLSEMTGGIYYEHAHRLYGMLVGLTSIALLWMVWRTDRRPWLRRAAIMVVIMVGVQGVMGGLGVTGRPTLSADPDDMRPLAALRLAHGVFAQAVFATLIVLAAAMSERWLAATRRVPVDGAWGDRLLGIACLVLLFGQLILGASIRHLREPGDIPAWALHGHLALAVILIGLLAYWGIRLTARGDAVTLLRQLGTAVLAFLGVQVVLGFAALVAVLLWTTEAIPAWLVAIGTAHQVTGAALIGTVALALAWHWRVAARADLPLPSTAR